MSALINPSGPPGRVVRLLAENAFEGVVSEAILAELRRCLAYPKVRKLLPLSDDEIELWISAVGIVAINVSPRTVPPVVAADSKDDIYIAAALEGTASYIVSGDDHLLELGEYQDVRIVTPRRFLDGMTT